MISRFDLRDLMPTWYQGIIETDLLMNLENDLFEKLRLQIEKVQSNQYVSTADSKTIALYEQMLGINPDAVDTLEMRRFRVLTRMTSQVPYTEKYLKELLSSFGDPAELTMFYSEYRLLVEMNFEKLGQVSEIEYIFRTVVPANILVDAQNELKAKVPKTQLFMASGMTNTELVMITQDVAEVPSISAPIYQPFCVVISDLEQTSQDIAKSPEIRLNQKSANALVNYQTIEITERGE
ncbi:putative phage tail protein [Enterococcus lactis]|uniref:putative phage tail protein n=1 Tax=Enterococcus lactis TaxID=357441 RepID=UPI0022E4EF6B|nr:putative phage tail protein [Enterococcus lactis]